MFKFYEFVWYFLALTHYILDFANLIKMKHEHFVALLQPKSMVLKLARMVFKGIHDDLPNLCLELKPL